MSEIIRGAHLSKCGRYRYRLTRRWGEEGEPQVCFIGLNPSTADADIDDATVRRWIGFCQRWGYSGFVTVNLYAFRATQQADLKKATNPVGVDNDLWIRESAINSDKVVCCWGGGKFHELRAYEVRRMLISSGIAPYCFGKTSEASGRQPKHPVRLAYSTQLEPV